SFGQNYNVTMVQMAAAYCSIVNGGNYYKPHVVKQILNGNGTVIQDVKPEILRTTCSKSTSDFLREALYQTVEGGTGTKAKIQGYHVGGKTGTAEKIPRSAKNYLVSFIGFAPVEDPQIVVYVIVDTPNLVGEAQATASFAIFIERKIMNDALQFLNIPPVSDTDPEDSINKKLSDSSEGISNEAMGEQVTSGSDDENEGGESETAETDEDGNAIVRTQAPPVTDEVISGDDEGFEIPDAVPNSGEGLEEQAEEAEEEDD
nr:penicillin-binding protein 2 [Oribacterium sp.]